MSLTSFTFYLFFAITLAIYYLFPLKWQWVYLLLFSGIFFCLSSNPITGLYLLGTIVLTHICCMKIQDSKGKNRKPQKYFLIGLFGNLSILVALKYLHFFQINYNFIAARSPLPIWSNPIRFSTPLGISFYTLQAIGLLADTHWKIVTPQKNPLKTALFIAFYPQLTSGPISKYDQLSVQLYAQHKFNWKGVAFGLQRMTWGVFKKLVISARLGVIVDTIYENLGNYEGLYIWLAAGLFMLQLYTDFSGCMDIILGGAECYGIEMTENFRTPFFSRGVQEFWQRWHITLGGWMKDYILFPLLRTAAWSKLVKQIKNKMGKKYAKKIPAYLGMLCVWIAMGIWHGGAYKYIVGQGIWFWIWIVIEQESVSLSKQIKNRLHIDDQTFGWHFFQSIRTFSIISFGNIFFRLNSFSEAMYAIKQGFSGGWNTWILFDGSLFDLGLNEKNVLVLVIGLLTLLIVSSLQEKESVRERLGRQNIVFRWGVVFLLIFSTIIFGIYGPDYTPAEFIYKGF